MELKLGSRQRDAAQRTPELLTHMNATRLHLHQGSRSVLASQSGCIRCDERYATTLKLQARAPCPPSSAFHVCVPSCPGTEAKGSTLASHNAQEKLGLLGSGLLLRVLLQMPLLLLVRLLAGGNMALKARLWRKGPPSIARNINTA